jgi:hypothetical protein
MIRARSEDDDDDDFDIKPLKRVRRFKAPTSSEEMAVLNKGFVNKNTSKNTQWAMKLFYEWKEERNKENADKCPEYLLTSPDITKLNFWLGRFVNEVRNQKGENYLPKTIQQILSGLQRAILEKTPDFPKFMDKTNPVYRELHRCCDVVYRQLHADGVGVSVRHADVFTIEEEDNLWSLGVLSVGHPRSLQRAVFYYVGKHFCVRGGEEQRKLKPSQFIRSADPDKYVYHEHGSKNRSGGLLQINIQNKTVPCLALPDNQPRCLVIYWISTSVVFHHMLSNRMFYTAGPKEKSP